MKFSLVIPVYQVEPYIRRCLLSCVKQAGMAEGSFEIIVVDDQTPDRSMEIVSEFQEHYPMIRTVTRERNGGLSAARNSGLAVAAGEYVWFVDSDDSIVPDALVRLLEELAAAENPDIMIFDAFYDSPEGQRLSHRHAEQAFSGSRSRFLPLLYGQHTAWTHLYRREFLNRNGLLFAEGFIHEDIEFNLRAYSCCRRFHYLPVPLYRYVVAREGSIISAGNGIARTSAYFKISDTAAKLLRIGRYEPDEVRFLRRTCTDYAKAALRNAARMSAENRRTWRSRAGWPCEELCGARRCADRWLDRLLLGVGMWFPELSMLALRMKNGGKCRDIR